MVKNADKLKYSVLYMGRTTCYVDLRPISDMVGIHPRTLRRYIDEWGGMYITHVSGEECRISLIDEVVMSKRGIKERK